MIGYLNHRVDAPSICLDFSRDPQANQKEDQIASKVRIEGDFKNPQTFTLDAIFEVLRNAFIQALLPSIDHEININSVGIKQPEDKRNFLQKIFSPAPKQEVKKK